LTGYTEWCNANEGRAYPLREEATRRTAAGAQLPDDILADACLITPPECADAFCSMVRVTPALLADRKKSVDAKRTQARTLQMKYFGPDGELFKKQNELVRPLQDQVFNAVRDVAKRKKLDFVFDQGTAIGVLYAAETNDISDEVLQKLGGK
jgi:hypothetical protein